MMFWDIAFLCIVLYSMYEFFKIVEYNEKLNAEYLKKEKRYGE